MEVGRVTLSGTCMARPLQGPHHSAQGIRIISTCGTV